MSDSTTVVHPFVGAGELRLGMTREEVHGKVGAPDEVWNPGEDPGERREAWEYRSHGWSLNFDEEDDWRLSGIDVYRPQVVGLEPQGMAEAAFLDAWSTTGQPELVEDRELRDLDVGIWYCRPLGLTFWTDEGVFEYLTVEPRWTENGLTIIWPEA